MKKKVFAGLFIGTIMMCMTACNLGTDNSNDNIAETEFYSEDKDRVTGELDTFIPKVPSNVKPLEQELNELKESADAAYGEGEDINNILGYTSRSDVSNSEVRSSIEIPRWDDVTDEEVYENIAKEASAIANENNFSQVDVFIEEYNNGGNYLDMVLRGDNSRYFSIHTDLGTKTVTSLENPAYADVDWDNRVYVSRYEIEAASEAAELNGEEMETIIDETVDVETETETVVTE